MENSNNTSPSKLIWADNVSIQFSARTVLQNIDLQINSGQVVSLIGPNGAGETTLVRILLGLLNPDSGTIGRMDDLRIGYMPQRVVIDKTLPLSVLRFLQLANLVKPSTIQELLLLLRIEHLKTHQLSSVSGGELQRVLLARALLKDPQLLILDEPAQGVDVAGQAELYQLIGDIRTERGCGVLMISHDLHLVMSSTDEVICLNHHVCCHGKPEQVSNDPAFLDLFGASASDGLAVYTHHHNHEHDLSGNIKD